MFMINTSSGNLLAHIRLGEQTLTDQDVRKLHYVFDLIDYLIETDPHFRSMVIAHKTKNRLTQDENDV